MKVTLISPYEYVGAFGIRSISASLKRDGHIVQLLFLAKQFFDAYTDSESKEIAGLARGSDLIGISLTTNYFYLAIQITQKLKKELNSPIIWGGIHPTVRPEECLDYADYICIGEGEESFREFVNKLKNGCSLTNVQNIWTKDGNKVIKNSVKPIVENLDSIPSVDYDCNDHYMLHNKHIHKMDLALMQKYIGWKGIYSTMATRGCPFGCTYCFNNTYINLCDKEKYVRKRSIDNIIKELLNIKNKYPFIKRISFDDDAFFIYTEEEIEKFCDEYSKYIKLPIRIGGASPALFTKKKLSLLIGVGLELIRIGVQTGSDRTKILYKRQHSNEQIEKIVATINEVKDKVEVMYDFILDNPWESESEIIETLMLLARFPVPYRLNLFSLALYPGTELFDKAKKDGKLPKSKQSIYQKSFQIDTKVYLNKLFLLSKLCAPRGVRVSPVCMCLLTNRVMRRFGISWFLYIALKIYGLIRFVMYLIYEGIKDIKRGDWSRIINYQRDV